MEWPIAVSALSLAAWLYLALLHGRFWRGDQRLSGLEPEPRRWPSVTAVVPARDEAALLPATLRSLLDQKYPGAFRDRARRRREQRRHRRGRARARARARERRAAARGAHAAAPGRLGREDVGGRDRRARGARGGAPTPEYWLLTDADVEHAPDNLRRLVAKAEARAPRSGVADGAAARGRGWGGLLVPAFVYFFQKLYPFPRVNDPRSRTAAAAGGCVLVRRDALERAGGIEALRGEVIDDCALGRNVKRGGPLWLGLSSAIRARSAPTGESATSGTWWRAAPSRSSRHSPWLLAGTLLGLALLYLVPPLAVLALAAARKRRGRRPAPARRGRSRPSTFVPTLALTAARPGSASRCRWRARCTPA